jgi:c-di-AMP phosphodiesterase-like protein
MSEKPIEVVKKPKGKKTVTDKQKANLVPLTTDKAREIGSKGGKASVEAKRKKKLMSQIYGDLLADQYDVKIDGKTQKIDGDKFVKTIARDVLMRRDGSSVSMLKEIREATEGNNINISGDLDIYEMSSEQREQRRKEIAEKRKRLGLD